MDPLLDHSLMDPAIFSNMFSNHGSLDASRLSMSPFWADGGSDFDLLHGYGEYEPANQEVNPAEHEAKPSLHPMVGDSVAAVPAPQANGATIDGSFQPPATLSSETVPGNGDESDAKAPAPEAHFDEDDDSDSSAEQGCGLPFLQQANFRCEHQGCTSNFRTRANRLQHYKKCHRVEKPVVCDVSDCKQVRAPYCVRKMLFSSYRCVIYCFPGPAVPCTHSALACMLCRSSSHWVTCEPTKPPCTARGCTCARCRPAPVSSATSLA